MCKGTIKKGDSKYKSLDFESQDESDSIIDFIGDMLEVYREELNCYANDRGGQTYSQQLVVTETLNDGDKAVVDLSTLGTSPFQPKNRPQALKLKAKKKIDFCLVVESEGTAGTLQSMGFTKRGKIIQQFEKAGGKRGSAFRFIEKFVKNVFSSLNPSRLRAMPMYKHSPASFRKSIPNKPFIPALWQQSINSPAQLVLLISVNTMVLMSFSMA
jgi:hypothetical protein